MLPIQISLEDATIIVKVNVSMRARLLVLEWWGIRFSLQSVAIRHRIGGIIQGVQKNTCLWSYCGNDCWSQLLE